MMGYPSIVVRSFGAVKREMKRTECLNTQPGFQFWNTKTDHRTRGALRKKGGLREGKGLRSERRAERRTTAAAGCLIPSS